MRIGVIGSGSWGTALACIAERASNHSVLIFSRNISICEEINNLHQNAHYLPGIILSNKITATNNLQYMLDLDILLLSIPAQNIRTLCLDLANLNLSSKTIIVICSKGIEQDSLNLMSEVVAQTLPLNRVAILSGPNFAHPAAQNLPTITSIAAQDIELSIMLANILKNPNFRIYANDDIIGTQIFGAVKNVLAIATGVVIGMELGENAKAAIISRGINEINSLCIKMGGSANTILSPAGIGDVHLTCSSPSSRNTTYGIALSKGDPSHEKLVEGFFTSKSVHVLAEKFGIKMPICQAVYMVTHEHSSLKSAIKELLK